MSSLVVMSWRRSGACALALLALASCKSGDTSITLNDSDGLIDLAQTIEIDVFDGECPSESDLENATFPPPVRQIITDKGEDLQPIGKLDAKKYGFGVVLRGADCSIVGYGCTPADLKSIRKIPINLFAATGPNQGLCQNSVDSDKTICDNGRCRNPDEVMGGGGSSGSGGSSGNGGSSGSSGAAGTSSTPEGKCKIAGNGTTGCKLELVGWAPLPAPRGSGSTLSTPAVTATDKGFVVGYNEVLANGDQAFTLAGVQLDGCYNGIHPGDTALTGGCTTSTAPIESGATWSTSKSQGLLTFGRSLCTGVGFGLVTFDSLGFPTDQRSVDPPNFTKLLAYTAPNMVTYGINDASKQDEFVITTLLEPNFAAAPLSFPINGVQTPAVGNYPIFDSSPYFPFSSAKFSGVARENTIRVDSLEGVTKDGVEGLALSIARDNVEAVYALRPAAQRAVIRPYPVSGSPERIVVMSRGSDGKLGWAVLSEDGSQVYPEVSGGTGGAGGAAGAGGAGGSASTGPSGTVSPLPDGLGFDAAVLGSYILLVNGQANQLQITPVKGATSVVVPGSPLSYNSDEAQIPPLKGFDGKLLAATATQGRLVVTWVNTSKPAATDSVGGVAVLKCE